MARTVASFCIALTLGMLVGTSIKAADTYGDAKPVPESLKQGFDTIQEEKSEEILEVLVEGGFQGRGTGQDGYVRAAHFVAGRLAEYGFEPIGDHGTYFQNLPYSRLTADPEATKITIGEEVFNGVGAIGFSSVADSIMVEGELTLIKTGGGRANLGSLDGKIVLLRSAIQDPRSLGRFRRSGATAIFLVVDGEATNQSTTSSGTRFGGGTIMGEVSAEAAAGMLAAAGIEADLEIDEDQETSITGSDQNVSIDLKVVREPLTVPNVVAWLPGSDPELADEYIVIGGHLDHLGVRGEQLFPGADDNGSGSTAILQVARALHENPVKPKRSVLYIAFAAEELGLIGSRYFTDNPLKPLDKCICMFNIDMVGRNEETASEAASDNLESIHLIGSQQYAEDLHELILQANEHVGFTFEYDEEERVFRRSDHANFYDHDIPVAFLFGGFNPHYHQPSDGMNDINFSKIANCARLYYLSIHMVSEHGRFERDTETNTAR